MFDKLIVSEPEGAEFKTRRSYFMVSSLVVGVLFASAVVVSIFATDYGLGTANFELVEMVAPQDLVEVEPEQVRPRTERTTVDSSPSDVPTRVVNIEPVADSTMPPTGVSVVQNKYRDRPLERFEFGTADSDGPPDSGRTTGASGATTMGIATAPTAAPRDTEEPPPPAVVEKKPESKPVPQSLGVINGRAAYLPKPIYSAAAKAVGAQGKVDVQVLIDESGRVVSAKTLGGHILLRPAAEQAARNAKFTPTYLSKVAVKVTGIISYNFTK